MTLKRRKSSCLNKGTPQFENASAEVIGERVITPPIATSDETGKAIASLSSQAVGNVVIKATVDSVESNSKTVTFVEGVYVYLPVIFR